MSVLNRILEISDIHQMTDYISKVLNKSVIVENKNFELIAYSSSGDYEFDLTQQKTILTKKCPTFIIERLKKEGIVQHLENHNEPIRIETIEEFGFYQRVVVRVIHNERTVGYIWILESNELLNEDEFEFLTTISSIVGKLVYDNNARNLKRETKEHRLLRQLINHEYVNEKHILNQAKLASISLPDRYNVMVVSILEPTFYELLKSTKKIIDSYTDIQVSSYFEDDTKIIVVIGGLNTKNNEVIKRTYQLIEYIKSNINNHEVHNLLFGMGNEYTQLSDMRKSFLQAVEVIKILSTITHSPNQFPFEYGKLGMYRYLMTIYEKNSTEGYINIDLLKLIQKDEENKSKLLKTLEVYLANNLKLKKTAKQLFIHPNTLNYRIKQIVDITDIDFEDFNMNSHLYTELLLLNNIKEYYLRYREVLQYYI